MTPPLHPDMEPLRALLGTWSGRGHGEYPTIEPFDYEETLTFTHSGKAFFSYSQSSRAVADGRSLHGERGFVRIATPDTVEFVIAHPNGIAEIAEGSLAHLTIALRSRFVTRTRTAKEVTSIERDYVITSESLHCSLRMAAVGQPLTHHLAAELRRTEPSGATG